MTNPTWQLVRSWVRVNTTSGLRWQHSDDVFMGTDDEARRRVWQRYPSAADVVQVWSYSGGWVPRPDIGFP